MAESEQELCTRQCSAHEVTMELIRGSITKASVYRIAAILSVPALAVIFAAWAFISSADYRYGTIAQAQLNAAAIRLLDERTVTIKSDIAVMKTDIGLSLVVVQSDLKDIAKELRAYNLTSRGIKP